MALQLLEFYIGVTTVVFFACIQSHIRFVFNKSESRIFETPLCSEQQHKIPNCFWWMNLRKNLFFARKSLKSNSGKNTPTMIKKKPCAHDTAKRRNYFSTHIMYFQDLVASLSFDFSLLHSVFKKSYNYYNNQNIYKKKQNESV